MSTGSLQIQIERAKARIGETLNDKWHLDSLLGVGGTATVYAATHRNGKRAAIKLIHPELVTNPDLVARFLREGYVANKLEHPGAVSILDDDRMADGSVFLVMELLDGYSLDHHTRRGCKVLPLEHVLRIADDVLDVLAAAHARGVIHRDIKPANIFLSRDGRTKVLDFGIARLAEPLADGSVTQTGTAIGTPAFMPPEQARGRWNLIDPRTDVWAVGATMFALIIGDRMRRAETVQEELLVAMTVPMPSLLTYAPHTPPAVAAIVDRALSFNMEGRWPDVRAMQRAIRAAVGAGLVQGASTTAPVAVGERVDGTALPQRGQGLVEASEAQLTTGRPLTRRAPEDEEAAPAPRPMRWWLASGVGAVIGLAVLGVFVAERRLALFPPSAATNTENAAPSVPSAEQAEPPAQPPPTSQSTSQAQATGATSDGKADAGTSAVIPDPPRHNAPSRPPSTRPNPPAGSAKGRSDPFDNRF